MKKAEQEQELADKALCTSKEKIRVQSEEIQIQSEELQNKYKELKESNESLRESEEHYRNIIKTANEGIWIRDVDAITTFVNEKMAKMLGYSREEMIGRFAWDFTDEEGKIIAKQNLEKRRQGHNDVHELKLIRKEGSPLWVLVSSKSLFDKYGKFTGILAMYTDITERKQEEQRIRRYNTILEGNNRIFSNVLQAKTKEELGNVCLSVALEMTGSLIGFIGLEDDDGLLHDIAISKMGWNQCVMYDKTGHRCPPKNFVVHGLYGSVIDSGKGFFTNKPLSHPDSIGLPFGHPPITSFLGVPLVLDGKTMGVIAVADREGGYSYEQQEDLEAIAPAMMQALHRKRSEEALLEAYENLQVQSEELRVQSDELQAQSDELQTQSEELKEANKALHESEKNYRTLAENSPDVIARLDRQKRYIYANPAAEEPYGWSLNEIIGKTHDELIIDSEEVKLWERHHEDVLTTGKNKIIEFYHISPQGKKYYFNTQIVPEFVDGEVTSVLAISRDITDILEAETRLKETLESLEEKVKERTAELEEAYNLLKESEEGLSEAQRMAHIGNWDWEIRTNKLYLSDEVYRIYGCGPQEFSVTRNVFLSYVHPDDRDYVGNSFKKALSEKPISIDYRIVLANGEERVVHAQGEVNCNEENIPVRTRGTIQDITERKIAEQKIQALANTVESSNDSIITESLDGIIASWNKGAEQVYGYLAEEVLGKNMYILEPDNLKGEIKQLADYIKQGKKIQHYETSRLKKDGTTINVSVTLSPVFDTSGKLVAISYIASDITEMKIAEKLLQEKQMAEVANSTKSEFLASMSHELRTPLNSIIGFSDMLYEQAYGELNKKQRRSVRNISESGKHLLNLINNILDISKIEAGKMELDYKNIELAYKLNMIRNILFPIADRKNIKIEIDMDSKLTNICVDEDKFIQIMYNLVDNAIKFSYENGLVEIGARKKGDLVEITVKDTGIGIKVEDQYKLFKPFSQIDLFSSRKYQGTGLGLSLVKQIVHLHGGYVWFKSNPSEGSIFAFAIPINNNKGNSGYVEYVELDQNA